VPQGGRIAGWSGSPEKNFDHRLDLTAPPRYKLNVGLTMDRGCIEIREGGFYLIGSRVPIDRLVWEYRNGEDPETIQSHYPTLSLEQVNGAITFYLAHKNEVEQAMEDRRREEDAYTAAHPTPPDIKEKFARMRQQMPARRS
jgi:uncharacterized protein (DUF433 family)